ncbi:F-box domain protein [Talaromyces stipitatus ATCC 10500]|uniref:F-box domain protein n=1 Tax=Talaromyces stipitatus (strain ATCC 10500 / CBS 375.48 / QM 6759 / NRRL 1006) TaxID=441959 RepID=B8LZ99_TALSN|nr:F-box domain protein [Talaromyces stipitatus ATCC 10500]EED21652.1 F-box domain protein [Talaromyces stipitatus ATCC 10500]
MTCLKFGTLESPKEGTFQRSSSLQIFRSNNSISDVVNLASTNRRLRQVFASSSRVTILMNVADAEFGPIHDIIQLITQNASQPAHLIRSASQSDALLKQVVRIGRVAQKWEVIYPLKKWKSDYENRRLLTDEERFRLRRAIYRLWLYNRAFHTSQYDRFSRRLRPVVVERSQLLHNWSTSELAEIEDVRMVIQDVVQNHICPSNGSIQRKFHKRYPENPNPLSFNIHLNYRPERSNLSTGSYFGLLENSSAISNYDSLFHNHYHSSNASSSLSPWSKPSSSSTFAAKLRTDLFHDPGQEGWGDEIPHYYVVQDMLKLDPGEVLWLRDHAPLKEDVESYVHSLGDWFRNNGETFVDTLLWVMNERGEDVEGLKIAVEDCEMGIVA